MDLSYFRSWLNIVPLDIGDVDRHIFPWSVEACTQIALGRPGAPRRFLCGETAKDEAPALFQISWGSTVAFFV